MRQSFFGDGWLVLSVVLVINLGTYFVARLSRSKCLRILLGCLVMWRFPRRVYLVKWKWDVHPSYLHVTRALIVGFGMMQSTRRGFLSILAGQRHVLVTFCRTHMNISVFVIFLSSCVQ